MTRHPPPDVMPQGEHAAAAWEKIDPNLKVGDETLIKFKSDIASVKSLDDVIAAKEIELEALRDQRHTTKEVIWDTTTRFHNTVKGTYGPDSEEYKLAGGTRESDRKPPHHQTT